MAKTAVKCGKLFDSASGQVLPNRTVLIDGDKITQVLTARDAGSLTGYEVIDLSQKFVMPGLIDCHVHLSMYGEPNAVAEIPYTTVGRQTLRGLAMAKRDLMAGFTTLRNCGSMGFSDVSIKKAINSGMHWGPRLFVCGPSIGTTGSHCDCHFGPYISEQISYCNIADGVDQMLEKIRWNIKYDVDYIKFMATGGVLSVGTTVGEQQMFQDEMDAICNCAKLYNMTTAAHAHGTSGIKAAIRAGVTSIEHGTLMDEECVDLMKEHGTYLVPTIIAPTLILEHGSGSGIDKTAVEKAESVMEIHRKGFRQCLKKGVKIAFGTDVGTPFSFHGEQAHEFELMVDFGMTPAQALVSATKTASELVCMADTVGTAEPGKYADLVAFEGDPTEDIKTMRHCSFVMKGGVVYKAR